jgi:hypothetical protein
MLRHGRFSAKQESVFAAAADRMLQSPAINVDLLGLIPVFQPLLIVMRIQFCR